MDLFATVFQQTAHLDGIVFKFDTTDEQHRQRIAGRFRDLIHRDWNPADEKEWGRCFKPKVFNMSKDHSRCILKIGLYGPALNTVHRFPAALMSYVCEAHFKTYIPELDDGGVKTLYDAIIWAKGGRQPTLYGNHPNPNSRKGTGVGVRIGDRNSDYNFVFYKRRSQRLGLELRIMGAACWRRAAKALDFATAYGQEDEDAWAILYRTLQHAAAEECVRDLRAKGVDLAENCRLTSQAIGSDDDTAFPFIFRTGDDDEVKTWTAIPLDLQ